MDASVLLHRIEQLPPVKRQEAEDFVEFLASHTRREPAANDRSALAPFRFDWAGALSRYKDQFTSVELQKQASRWRTES